MGSSVPPAPAFWAVAIASCPGKGIFTRAATTPLCNHSYKGRNRVLDISGALSSLTALVNSDLEWEQLPFAIIHTACTRAIVTGSSSTSGCPSQKQSL